MTDALEGQLLLYPLGSGMHLPHCRHHDVLSLDVTQCIRYVDNAALSSSLRYPSTETCG
jgi:hypothetical protein